MDSDSEPPWACCLTWSKAALALVALGAEGDVGRWHHNEPGAIWKHDPLHNFGGFEISLDIKAGDISGITLQKNLPQRYPILFSSSIFLVWDIGHCCKTAACSVMPYSNLFFFGNPLILPIDLAIHWFKYLS